MEKVINFNEEKVARKVGQLKRQAKVVKKIAISSAWAQLENQQTHLVATTVGLAQAMKYKGSFKTGAKGALMTYGMIVGGNVVANLFAGRDEIKKA